MTDGILRILLPLGFVLFCVYALYGLISSPGSYDSYVYLAALISLEILVVVFWNFQRSFLPILILTFLWAGTGLPLQSVGTSARWLVLSMGAVAGFVIYMKKGSTFGTIHLLTLFCGVSALVSAMASSYPRIALLKTGSLLLVFLYGATGARLAIMGREAKFIAGLILGCELLVYFVAVSYFILHYPLFGNPNSLGVVMGVVTTPVMLWAVIVSEGTRSYPRRVFVLILSVLLLLSSYGRAGIGAAVFSSVFLCLCLGRYRTLVKGAAVALAGALLVAATIPLPEGGKDLHTESTVGVFLYKGKAETGVFGSRLSPWKKTTAVIQQHPWFGSGFGTSQTSVEGRQWDYAIESTSGSSREHGNSYIALLEWVGLLGIVPFFLLILLVLVNVGRVGLWMRRTRNPFAPAVPIAAVVAAGAAHAIFEDWMFAPGYYMCVFFWALVFILADVLPATEPVQVPSASPYSPPSFSGSYVVASPGR